MHYGRTAFSQPGCIGINCTTISINNEDEYDRQGRPRLGQVWLRDALSPEDIIQANRLYSCSCKSAGKGIWGNLTFFVRHGYNLIDTDLRSNPSNPYVRVTAVDCSGKVHVKQTRYVANNRYLDWNESIAMGANTWQFFRITVLDHNLRSDHSDDGQITMSQTIVLQPGRHQNLRHCKNFACKSYIMFDYDVSDAVKNSILQVKVRSAKSLMDSSNDPASFVHVEAVQENGISRNQTSRTVYNTTGPV